jgi:SCP-2 sterol transfer family
VDRGTATAEFFEQLGRRGHVPALEEVKGTIRFDLRNGQATDQWFVAIDNGNVRVSRETGPADCVVHIDRAVFDQFVTGELHSMPAWLRHQFWVDGNVVIWRAFDHLFPGPAHARHPRDKLPHGRRRR